MMKINDVTVPEFWMEQWYRMNSSVTASSGYSSRETWNAMADSYGRNPDRNDKDESLTETLYNLEKKGIKFENCRILDVGCGPGKYAQAFARRGAEVVCIDIAEKMIARLNREVDSSANMRITSIVADWKNIDLESMGFVKTFDLVFANMTPAISGPETFLKIMQASRQWCWFRGWAGPRENPLLERLYREISGAVPAAFNGNFTYAMNLLNAFGYYPDCTYETIQWVQKKTQIECLEFYQTFFGTGKIFSKDNLNKLGKILLNMSVDGYIENRIKGHTGRMIWSINEICGGEND